MRLSASSPIGRSAALAAAGILVLASCGGGDDATSVLSGDDDGTAPAATDPPSTDATTTSAAPITTVPPTAPPPTAPPSTAPPSTAPATQPPSTDADYAPAGADPAYCGASSQFYVEARALREIEENDNEAARRLFDRMQISLTATLINAPDEATAATPRRMEQVFEIILPAFDSVEYELDDLDFLPNSEEVATAFEEFVGIIGELETFLTQGCGVDVEALDRQAVDLAEVVASEEVPPDSLPGDGDTPDAVQSVVDDSGAVSVDVPVEWSEVRGAPDGELRQLIVAPDIEAFLAGYSEPGVVILSGDAPAGNAAAAAQGALDGFRTSIEGDGCVEDLALPYDDGLYSGDLLSYSCPGTSSITRLAGGTNSAGDVFWLLAVVTVDGDESSWPLVTDSFLVD